MKAKVLSVDDKFFTVKPAEHIKANGYKYVPFTGEGIMIEYGDLKKLLRPTGRSPKQYVEQYIGKDVDVEYRRMDKYVKRDLGEMGKITDRNLRLILTSINLI